MIPSKIYKFAVESSSKIQWNLPERPPIQNPDSVPPSVKLLLVKLPVSDHLSLAIKSGRLREVPLYVKISDPGKLL